LAVSTEVNYGIRFSKVEELFSFLHKLSRELAGRVGSDQLVEECCRGGRCVTLKLLVKADHAPAESRKFMGHGICDAVSKSVTLAKAIKTEEDIAR